jgi:colanic acid/amylovoran biosynthesis glycosyltransferase
MKNKILILLTATFPNDQRETFVQNEIEYLSASFSKVIIVPIYKTNATKEIILPDNVFLAEYQPVRINYNRVIKNIFQISEIRSEFLQNTYSNIFKNKILIKSVQNAISIKDFLEKLLNNENENAYYVYSYWLNDAAIALALHKGKKWKKISRAHGWDIYKERHLYNYLPLRRFLTKNLHGIYCISEHGYNTLFEETPSQRIFLSRLGTSEIGLQEQETKSSSGNIINIITIGNAIPLKRIHLIGEALLMLNQKEYFWSHYGDGPLLNELKNSFSNGNFVGWIDNESLKIELKRLSNNSLLINTSESEGIPVSMMEAMSLGIPCIGSNVGGVPEIIDDGVNGYFLDKNPSPKEIARHIKDFMNLSQDEKNKIKRNARKTWEEKYNAEKNYKEFICSAFD